MGRKCYWPKCPANSDGACVVTHDIFCSDRFDRYNRNRFTNALKIPPPPKKKKKPLLEKYHLLNTDEVRCGYGVDRVVPSGLHTSKVQLNVVVSRKQPSSIIKITCLTCFTVDVNSRI